MTYLLQATFSRGELSPELSSRVDLEMFRSGLYECTNFITLKRGGIRRRGGTKYIGEVKDSGDGARLIPFIFSETQSYMLEFGDEYFRVWTSDGRIGTVEVATPYSISEVSDIKYAQSADTMYLAHPNHPPQQIQRAAETSWSITEIDFEDGPYLDLNETGTSLKPSGTAYATADMTGLSTPSGVVSSTSPDGTEWKAFDRDKSTFGKIGGDSSGSLTYDLGSGNDKVVDSYWITSPDQASYAAAMPEQWSIQGSDNASTWIVLDTRASQTSWGNSETRYYKFQNTESYRYYRISFTGGGGASGGSTWMGEIAYHQSADDQTAFNLTASSTTGVNGGDGFKTTDAGRHIRLRGSDGVWRWGKVVARSSSTVVTIKLYDYALPDTTRAVLWKLGAWSDETGWPASVRFVRDRLCFGGTTEEPQKVWCSQAGDYTNFAVSSPLEASDAITVPINSGSIDAVQWLEDNGDIVVGTISGTRIVGRDISTDAFGPENNKQDPAGPFGSNGSQPVILDVPYFWGRFGLDLRAFYFDSEQNSFTSRSVSEISNHLYSNGVIGGAYQQYPSSVLWQWDSVGAVIGFTHEKDQQVFGFHSHSLGGEVESIAAIPTATADEPWFIVKRTIDGATVRYIEVMQPVFNGGSIEDAWHLDCAALYSGAAANTVTGLDHLEGEDIILYADGADYTATVSGGEASLPDGVTATPILCGLDVQARAKMLPPPANAQDGSSIGRKMKVDDCRIHVYETGSLKVGSDLTNRDEIIPYLDDASEEEPLRSGLLTANTEMRWSEGGQLVMECSGGKPATVLAVNLNLSMEP